MQTTLLGIDARHPVLDEGSATRLDHFAHIKAHLLRSVGSSEQAGPHAGIVVIGTGADQRHPMPPGDEIGQIQHHRHMYAAAADQYQVLAHGILQLRVQG
ncbi:MAG: hypothetical protein R2864_04245 [Syntrophotaleaceae bacterium]